MNDIKIQLYKSESTIVIEKLLSVRTPKFRPKTCEFLAGMSDGTSRWIRCMHDATRRGKWLIQKSCAKFCATPLSMLVRQLESELLLPGVSAAGPGYEPVGYKTGSKTEKRRAKDYVNEVHAIEGVKRILPYCGEDACHVTLADPVEEFRTPQSLVGAGVPRDQIHIPNPFKYVSCQGRGYSNIHNCFLSELFAPGGGALADKVVGSVFADLTCAWTRNTGQREVLRVIAGVKPADVIAFSVTLSARGAEKPTQPQSASLITAWLREAQRTIRAAFHQVHGYYSVRDLEHSERYNGGGGATMIFLSFVFRHGAFDERLLFDEANATDALALSYLDNFRTPSCQPQTALQVFEHRRRDEHNDEDYANKEQRERFLDLNVLRSAPYIRARYANVINWSDEAEVLEQLTFERVVEGIQAWMREKLGLSGRFVRQVPHLLAPVFAQMMEELLDELLG